MARVYTFARRWLVGWLILCVGVLVTAASYGGLQEPTEQEKADFEKVLAEVRAKLASYTDFRKPLPFNSSFFAGWDLPTTPSPCDLSHPTPWCAGIQDQVAEIHATWWTLFYRHVTTTQPDKLTEPPSPPKRCSTHNAPAWCAKLLPVYQQIHNEYLQRKAELFDEHGNPRPKPLKPIPPETIRFMVLVAGGILLLLAVMRWCWQPAPVIVWRGLRIQPENRFDYWTSRIGFWLYDHGVPRFLITPLISMWPYGAVLGNVIVFYFMSLSHDPPTTVWQEMQKTFHFVAQPVSNNLANGQYLPAVLAVLFVGGVTFGLYSFIGIVLLGFFTGRIKPTLWAIADDMRAIRRQQHT